MDRVKQILNDFITLYEDEEMIHPAIYYWAEDYLRNLCDSELFDILCSYSRCNELAETLTKYFSKYCGVDTDADSYGMCIGDCSDETAWCIDGLSNEMNRSPLYYSPDRYIPKDY